MARRAARMLGRYARGREGQGRDARGWNDRRHGVQQCLRCRRGHGAVGAEPGRRQCGAGCKESIWHEQPGRERGRGGHRQDRWKIHVSRRERRAAYLRRVEAQGALRHAALRRYARAFRRGRPRGRLLLHRSDPPGMHVCLRLPGGGRRLDDGGVRLRYLAARQARAQTSARALRVAHGGTADRERRPHRGRGRRWAGPSSARIRRTTSPAARWRTSSGRSSRS